MTDTLDAPDFMAFFEAAPHPYMVLDPNLRVVAANDAYCDALRVTPAMLVGHRLDEYVDAGRPTQVATLMDNLRNSVARVVANGQPHTLPRQRFDLHRPPGSEPVYEERYWTTVNTPVIASDGSVRWIISSIDDSAEVDRLRGANNSLSERNEALQQRNERLTEQAIADVELQRSLNEQIDLLRRSSIFFDTVIENIPALLVVKDARTLKYLLLNRVGEDMLGLTRDEMVGRTDADLFPADLAEALIRTDREVVSSGVPLFMPEEAMNTRHKGLRYVRSYRVPIHDAIGRPEYVVTMASDITEQKEAAAALQKSEGMLASMMQATPDVMLALDPAGRVLLANERVRDVLGHDPAELVGRDARTLLTPDTVTDSVERGRLAMRGRPDGIRGRVVNDLTMLRANGEPFAAEASLSHVETEDGVISMVALRDVTERKAVEQQLRQAMKMDALGNLTGGLAHDFNNLLSVVIGNLDLLRDQLSRGSSIDLLADEALAAALRGAELTRHLLAFARRQPLAPKVVDVNDLIEGVMRLLSRTLGANVQIDLKLGEDIWRVMVDPVQLEASLLNLATNARDAMPRGGTLSISTQNRHLDEDYVQMHAGLEAGDYTLIEVTDSGTGVPHDMLEHIFEPFFTTKKEGQGTGLGLSMVFGFMKQSGGHINVYSEEVLGTTFRLYLPRARNTGEVRPASEPTAFALGAAETVLAVEDNPNLRNLVVRQLKQLGYKCLEAEDAPAALRLLERHHVDLLFSDVIMPGGMSGYELGRLARTRWPHLKVLLTSGFPEEKLNGNGQPPWNMRLLLKPYRREDLAMVLREVLAEPLG